LSIGLSVSVGLPSSAEKKN